MSSTKAPRTRSVVSRWVVALVIVAVLAAIVGAALVLTRSGSAASALPAGQFEVTTGSSDCGHGWEHPTAGLETIDFRNTDIGAVEVYVENASTHGVYVDLEGFGPGATATEQVTLGNGSYRIVCTPDDGTPTAGAVVSIAGASAVSDPTPALVPITQADIVPAVTQYEHWLAQRMPSLLAQTRTLDRLVRAGDNRGARRAWLRAHTSYETLGAAYDAFGEWDAKINGNPAIGRTALDDPDLTGFHKIEAMLWSGTDPPKIATYTSRLVKDVQGLAAYIPTLQIEPTDLSLRAHEILENAIQFELTGSTDAGSHTSLATIDANITGSLAALAPLRSLLEPRFPQLAELDQWMTRSQRLVESYDHDGSWTPLNDLSITQRSALNATLGEATELLADVAAIGEVRPAP